MDCYHNTLKAWLLSLAVNVDKCGSEEFEFRSSLAAIEDNAGAGEAGEAMSEDVSFNAIHSKFDKSEIN